MDLSTRYLGLELEQAIIAGASPLVDDLDAVMAMEQAGVGAIVMHSLFEEQITREQLGTIMDMEIHAESFAEAISYFPEPSDFRLGPEQYLEQITKVRNAVTCPVIGSLNGATGAGWVDYARRIQDAGADALELNFYHLPTRSDETGLVIEQRLVGIARAVKAAISIPVAVKLSPFFSSLPNLAMELDKVGVDGLVLFNRFYQPDIDIEELTVKSSLELSTSSELLLRLRWTAILSGRIKADIAVSGGVHTPADVLKAVMAGADVVQVVSAVLEGGPGVIKTLRQAVEKWLEEHEYESLGQARASMNLDKSPNSSAFERANYMKVLNSWRV